MMPVLVGGVGVGVGARWRPRWVHVQVNGETQSCKGWEGATAAAQ